MRWIFFVLVAANVLLFGWQWWEQKNPTPDTGTDVRSPEELSADVPSITLLREVKKERQQVSRDMLVTTPTEEAPTASQEGAEATEKPLCTFIGPFATTERAEQLVERLTAMNVGGRVANVEIPAGPGYWVVLEPLPSRREALRRLTELQAQGLDSFIIPRGELMNGISLGMFSKESLARTRVEELNELGIEAKLQVVERSHQEIWVSVPAAEAEYLGDQGWQRLLESTKDTERRQNFCLHVASQDNFH